MDRTTKALLLFIALGLWANVLSVWLPPVSAASGQLDRGVDVVKVQIVSIDESPSLRWEALPVAVQ